MTTIDVSPGIASPSSPRGVDETAPWRHIDWVLVAAVVALAAIGVVVVFSATRGPTDPASTSYLWRHAAFSVLGAGVMAMVASVDYRFARIAAGPAYVGSLALLVAVLVVGSERKGTQAWFDLGPLQLQPSELAKVVLIVVLAAVLAKADGDVRGGLLVRALLLAAVPIALVLAQPDLGTVLVFGAVVAGQIFVAGVRGRHLVVLVVVGLLAVTGILRSDLLETYQRDRLAAFLAPGSDEKDTTYNVDQSQLAIGSGGLWGKGLFEGPQTRGGRVPEQQTDFIFTVVGEELGFAGGASVLGLLGVVVWRIWRAARLARDGFGMLLCVGALAMIVFQTFQNVGMTMQIMPVTGIPLPFLSYGGSSALAVFAACGLALNVGMRRFR